MTIRKISIFVLFTGSLSFYSTYTMEIPTTCDFDEKTIALHTAASKNNITKLAELKLAGVDLNAQDDQGYTACHVAVDYDAHDALRWLHEAGADINIYDKRGGAPVHWAITKGKPKTVHQLLMLGAQLDILTKESALPPSETLRNLPGPIESTPFHVAAYRNDPAAQAIKKILLFHALLAGAQKVHQLHDARLNVTISCKSEPVSAHAFVEMFCSHNQDVLRAAKALLHQRAQKLVAILGMRDSHYNRAHELEQKIPNSAQHAPLFNTTHLQHHMENFIMALQAGALEKLSPTNMFKAAHDAMEEYAPSHCVIC